VISGRKTLDDVKREYREERRQLREIDKRLQAANERIISVDAARADQLARLARIRVGEPDSGPAATDERIATMLGQRREARAKLEARARELDETALQAEEKREALTEAVEAASERLDAAEAETQTRLEQDETYRKQRERAQAAERTARHAAEKATQSEEERAAKGRAYEQDALFTYLWRRRYGTREYRAWGITRWLDRLVARIVAFDSARANYARLIELPVRLREHADAMAAAAEAEIVELRRLDEEARSADGVLQLERERDVAAEALEKHDAALAEAASARQEITGRLEQMDRGADEAYGKMVAFLTAELNREDLQTLRQEALATPAPQDDAVVRQLLALEKERTQLTETVTDLTEASEGARQRVRDLQEFQRTFTERHYDAPGSGFPDSDLVSTMLTQFLRGAITSAVLWRVLEGQRRGPSRRSDPTFGSGGFGRGSPWSGGHWPRSTRGGGGGGGGGFRPPAAPRSGGGMTRGGFKTGGRMTRGGFGTGRRRR
jgi:hypothetical protein